MRITLIGGSTALLEIGGIRLLTDPTFDPVGSEYGNLVTRLVKTAGPSCSAADLEPIDAVLQSHDQHFDNLDHAGKAFLPRVRSVFTTPAGAERLQGNAIGLAPWQAVDFVGGGGETIEIMGMPGRHGPPGYHAVTGDVTGFLLTPKTRPEDAVYVTGDTVWYEGVEEIASRYQVRHMVLFAGAACILLRGPFHLTMNVKDALSTARAFPLAQIYPVHHQGWAHFTENQQDLIDGFREAGIVERLHPLEPGVAVEMV